MEKASTASGEAWRGNNNNGGGGGGINGVANNLMMGQKASARAARAHAAQNRRRDGVSGMA